MLTFSASAPRLSGRVEGRLNGKPIRTQTSRATMKAESRIIDNLPNTKWFFACRSPRIMEHTSRPTSQNGSISVGGNPPVKLKRTSYATADKQRSRDIRPHATKPANSRQRYALRVRAPQELAGAHSCEITFYWSTRFPGGPSTRQGVYVRRNLWSRNLGKRTTWLLLHLTRDTDKYCSP